MPLISHRHIHRPEPSVALIRGFYARPTTEVARDLLGQVVEHRSSGGVLRAVIVETEAYLGHQDPASHSHRGPTPRSRVMFGPPGVAYVYFIYGMHHCLNAVTEPEGVGAAVLIRAVNPLAGAAAETTVERPLLGPGLVCRGLGIDLGMNGWDLTDSPLRILAGLHALDDKVLVGPRVGISSARALPLRYRLS